MVGVLLASWMRAACKCCLAFKTCFCLTNPNLDVDTKLFQFSLEMSTACLKHPLTIAVLVSNATFQIPLAFCWEVRTEPLSVCEHTCNESQHDHRHLTFRRKEMANKRQFVHYLYACFRFIMCCHRSPVATLVTMLQPACAHAAAAESCWRAFFKHHHHFDSWTIKA